MTDLICKSCGKSIWVHKEMDYSGEWKEGDSCEEFEATEEAKMTNYDKNCKTCRRWYEGSGRKRCEKHNPKPTDREKI